MEKKKEIIKWIIAFVLALMVGVTVFQVWHIKCYYKMEPSACEGCYIINQYYKTEFEPDNLSHKQIKSWIDKEIDTNYWIEYKQLKDKKHSRSIVLFRKIEVDIYQTADKKYEFAKALAHEQIHIKYQMENETFVTYKTITTLFESDNEFLKFVAVDYANDVLTGGYRGTIYDCGQQLFEYFKDKDVTIRYI